MVVARIRRLPGIVEESSMNTPDPAAVAASQAKRGLGERILMTLLFALVFWVLCWVVGAAAVVQVVLRLFGRPPGQQAQRLCATLARYAGQVVAFLTFASDREPFPFSDWPDAPPGTTGDDLSGL